MKFILMIIMMTIGLSPGLIAEENLEKQDENTLLNLLQDENNDNDDDDFFEDDDDNFFSSSFKYESYFRKSMPTIEMSYGFSLPSIHEDEYAAGDNFAQQPFGEIKLGTINKDVNVFDNQTLVAYDFGYVLFSYMSSSLGSEEAEKLQTESYRFGLGDQSGLGYKFSEHSDIIFYRGHTWQWTMIDFEEKDLASLNDTYEDAFRFGTSFEGGIKFFVVENIGIGAAYENSIVFPRHMFWYWVGSEAIYHAGDGILGWFLYSIKKSSPMAAPVVSFVLKNAYSYAYYKLLRSNDMNWPISTAQPFVFEQFKVNLSFAF
jgi:hypothetical protein